MASKKILTQLDLQTITSLLEVDSVNFIGLASKIDGLYMKKRGQNELRLLTTADILTGGHDAITITNIGNTPNAKGLTLNGQQLNLEPASINYGGIITIGNQEFSGEKTFVDDISIKSSIIVGENGANNGTIRFVGITAGETLLKCQISNSINPTIYLPSISGTLALVSQLPSVLVSSVFGRTGAVVAANGDYNTSQVTEGTNLYFTDSRTRAAISLTTLNSSGASTYNNSTGILNIPNYSLTGLGGVPKTRTITINGEVQDLSANRTWNVGDLLASGNYSNPTWLTSLAWSKITNKPTTFYGYGITETPWTSYLPLSGGTLTGDLNSKRIICQSIIGDDYNTGAIEIWGSYDNTFYPTLGFHQPSKFAASIQLRGAIDFGLYAQGGTTLANLTANKLITTSLQLGTSATSGYVLTADASGNATWQASQGGTGSSHDPVTLGTANGLSINNQVLSLGLAAGSTNGALSSTDWNIFNNKVSFPGFGLNHSTASYGDHLHTEIYVPYENAIHDVNLGNYKLYTSNVLLNSDIRLKNNIQNIPINNIDVKYKEFEFNSNKGEKRYGVIAQELLEVAPQFVNKDKNGFYTVKYIDLLIHEVNYLKQEIIKLKTL